MELDIRVGTILICEKIAGSEKMLRLEVDLGDLGNRQILTGIGKWYSPEDLVGMKTIFLTNIEPKVMMGLESQGMLMAVDSHDGKPVFLTPNGDTVNGDKVI